VETQKRRKLETELDSRFAVEITRKVSENVWVTDLPQEIWFVNVVSFLNVKTVVGLYASCKFFYDSTVFSKRFDALRFQNNRQQIRFPKQFPQIQFLKQFGRPDDRLEKEFLQRIYETDNVEMLEIYLGSCHRTCRSPLYAFDVVDNEAFEIMKAILTDMSLGNRTGITDREMFCSAINADSAIAYDISKNHFKLDEKSLCRIVEGAIKSGRVVCSKKILNDLAKSTSNVKKLLWRLKSIENGLSHLDNHQADVKTTISFFKEFVEGLRCYASS
jgi:hypothetical protein